MNEAVLVHTADGEYEILYINGEKEMESDNIDKWSLLEILNNQTPIHQFVNKRLSFDALNRLDYRFPQKYSEFNETDFEK